MAKKVLYWFRNDLRIADNYPLLRAQSEVEAFFPVFCFDERWFSKDSLGFPRTNGFRTKFLIETITELQHSLNQLGSGLYITFGKPEEQIPPLAFLFGAEEVWAMRENTYNEALMEMELEKNMNIPMRLFDTNSLLPSSTLPFPIKKLPDFFLQFKKAIEPVLHKVKPVAQPTNLPPYPTQWGYGEIPDIKHLSPGFAYSNSEFTGGERFANQRLSDFFNSSPGLSEFSVNQNSLIGKNLTSKLSPWISNGSISVRSIFSEIRTQLLKNDLNISYESFNSQLLWREFFHLVARKNGLLIFRKKGIGQTELFYRNDKKMFQAWTVGKTGRDLVDALMRELLQTGYISNRGRQIVSNFLCKDLKIDWRYGARWFESSLIDYDAASNYGNWMYIAGVGNDPRPMRYFNLEKQNDLYDSDNKHRKTWLPERFT